MKTVRMETVTLDHCVAEAQHQQVILTRNGNPVALVVGVEGMDEKQVRLDSSSDFWTLIVESRRQKTMSREELERRLAQKP